MPKEITLDDLAVLIKGEFDRVDDRLGSIDTRLDGVETRLSHVETRLDSVETKVDTLEVRFDTLETKIDELDHKVTRIDYRTQNQVDATYVETTELKERVVRVEKHLGLKPLSSARA